MKKIICSIFFVLFVLIVINNTNASVNKSEITEVISVCSAKDSETWKKASSYIIKNIQAQRYSIFVPDNEVALFKEISPKQFNVIPESTCIPNVRHLLQKYMPPEKQWRLGWYLQQFIKIAAVKQANKDDIILIWDADTVPLKKLDFINSDGKLIYYKGDEFHRPYFDCIDRLLGIKKQVNFSFIAQSFIVKASWIQTFCHEIEEKSKMSWEEAIISKIDFNEISGFSEYETLGTYFMSKYASDITTSENPWHRMGNSLIGSVTKLNDNVARDLAKKYDFVSFEVWDKSETRFEKVLNYMKDKTMSILRFIKRKLYT
jgi:hypothetical protein